MAQNVGRFSDDFRKHCPNLQLLLLTLSDVGCHERAKFWLRLWYRVGWSGQLKNLIFIIILFFVGYGLIFQCATAELRRYIGTRFVACFCIITIMGFVAPNAILYFVAVVVTFVLSVKDRMDAVCRYVLMTPLISFVYWNSFVGSIYLGGFDQSIALGVALLISSAFMKKDGIRSWKGASPEDFAIAIVFVIFWLGSDRLSSFTIFLRSGLLQALYIILPFWVVRRSIKTLDEFPQIIALFGVTTVFLAVFAVYETRSNWSLFDYISQHLSTVQGMAKNSARRGDLLRSSVTMMTPLNLACYMSLGLVALVATRRFYKSGMMFALLVAIAFLGLLAPQSRGNLICVLAGLLMLAVAWRKWGYVALTMGGGGMAALALLVAAGSSQRVASFLKLDDTSAAQSGGVYDYRQLLLDRGIQEGMKNPLFGSTLTDAATRLSDIKQGEHIVDLVNIYLIIFLASGFIGLISAVAFFIWSFWKSQFGFPSRMDRDLMLVRGFTVSGLVVILIEFSFMSFIDRIPYMLGFVLVGARLTGMAKRGAWKQARLVRSKQPLAPAPIANLRKGVPVVSPEPQI